MASGKKYGQPLMCPYCKRLDNPSIHHDHFLNCITSNERKRELLKTIENKLETLSTPTKFKNEILK